VLKIAGLDPMPGIFERMGRLKSLAKSMERTERV